MKKRVPPCVLTIAGSDSGAGAGIQADSRAIHELGGFAATAITAVTAQNTNGIAAWRAIPSTLIDQQITAVCSDLPVAALKTGLLPGAASVRTVAAALRRMPALPLVVDPVIGSSSGTRFLARAGLRVLVTELIPLATVVTPNWPEAAQLSGQKVSHLGDAEAAGRIILRRSGCNAVLVKGGHGGGGTCDDLLLIRGGELYVFSRPRIRTQNTHGTGCTLAAAIATQLALGDDLPTAVAFAGEFLHEALRNGCNARWGAGHGPAFAGAKTG